MALKKLHTPSYPTAVSAAGLVIVLLAIGMIVTENWAAEDTAGLYLESGKLSNTQQESLTVMLDLVTLQMNWAIAIIGAAGFFLKLTVDKDIPVRKLDLLLSFAIILLSVTSLFLGHLVVDSCVQVLALDQFPVTNETVRKLGRIQYISGLGAVALFGFHIFQFFWAQGLRNTTPKS